MEIREIFENIVFIIGGIYLLGFVYYTIFLSDGGGPDGSDKPTPLLDAIAMIPPGLVGVYMLYKAATYFF